MIIKTTFIQFKKMLLIWLLVTSIVMGVFSSFWPTFESNSEQFLNILKKYPEQLIALISGELLTLLSFEGYYANYLMLYAQLIIYVFASYIGIKIFHQEFQVANVDFLFTKPRKFLKIVVDKSISGLCLIGIINLGAYLTGLGIVIFYQLNELAFFVLQTHFTIFIISIFFFELSSLIYLLVTKINSSIIWATNIVLASYFLKILNNLNELKIITNLNVLNVLDLSKVATSNISVTNYLVIIGLTIILFALKLGYLSKKKFRK